MFRTTAHENQRNNISAFLPYLNDCMPIQTPPEALGKQT